MKAVFYSALILFLNLPAHGRDTEYCLETVITSVSQAGNWLDEELPDSVHVIVRNDSRVWFRVGGEDSPNPVHAVHDFIRAVHGEMEKRFRIRSPGFVPELQPTRFRTLVSPPLTFLGLMLGLALEGAGYPILSFGTVGFSLAGGLYGLGSGLDGVSTWRRDTYAALERMREFLSAVSADIDSGEEGAVEEVKLVYIDRLEAQNVLHLRYENDGGLPWIDIIHQHHPGKVRHTLD